MNTVELRQRILEFEKQLNELKHLLFITRFTNIVGAIPDNISSVCINVSGDTWNVSYKYVSNIKNHSYENQDNITCDEQFLYNISFGKNANNKYYIKNSDGINRFKIYSDGQRIKTVYTKYELVMTVSDHKTLLQSYENNIPECLAIKFFLHVYVEKWNDNNITAYLGHV